MLLKLHLCNDDGAVVVDGGRLVDLCTIVVVLQPLPAVVN